MPVRRAFAGKNCSRFFSMLTSYQNDQVHEILASRAGSRYKRVMSWCRTIRPGKDSAAAIQARLQGEVVEESYMPLGTLDFQVELSRSRR